jgi:DNA-binding NarL/FixJ family response regulator
MTEKTTTVETKILMQEQTRRHLRIMSAENGASMSGIVESLIEREWKATGHTAEYSARYAGTGAYKTHAQEREELVLKLHEEGQSTEQIAAALPRHLRTTLGEVRNIIEDAETDYFVESMRGETR